MAGRFGRPSKLQRGSQKPVCTLVHRNGAHRCGAALNRASGVNQDRATSRAAICETIAPSVWRSASPSPSRNSWSPSVIPASPTRCSWTRARSLRCSRSAPASRTSPRPRLGATAPRPFSTRARPTSISARCGRPRPEPSRFSSPSTRLDLRANPPLVQLTPDAK
jgi:hypothetical protein